MPGPIVDEIVAFLTYLPLAAEGFARITASISVFAFSASRSLSKLTLPNRRVNHAGLVDSELDLAGFGLAHRASRRQR